MSEFLLAEGLKIYLWDSLVLKSSFSNALITIYNISIWRCFNVATYLEPTKIFIYFLPCSHNGWFARFESKECQILILDFDIFFYLNYCWQCVLSYGVSYIHLKSCWLTQESLEHDPFSIFCLIWPNSISGQFRKKS